MPTPNINDVLSRVVGIANEGLASIGVVADTKPYFWHTQASFPYLTIRVSNVVYGDYPDELPSEDIVTDVYTLTLRLVLDHITADYDGRNEYRLYEMIPAIREYLKRRELLQSATALNAPAYLRYALDTGNTGLRVFTNSGVDTNNTGQVGCEFTIECTFDYPLEQDYF